MAAYIEQFLKKLGVSDDLRTALMAEEPGDDFNFDEQFTSYIDDQKHVWLSRLQSEIKADIDNKEMIVKKQLAVEVAKTMGLDVSNADAKKMGFDAVLKLVPDHIETIKSEASNSTDKDLKSKLADWQQKATDWKTKYEDSELSITGKVEEVENKYKAQIADLSLGAVFAREFKKLKYGVPAELAEMFEERVMRELKERYSIDSEGNLMSKDGKTKAVSFDENSIYSTLSEPISHLAAKYKVVQKSNTSQPPNTPPGGPVPPNGKGTGEMTDNAKALKQRMLDNINQQNKLRSAVQ